MMKFDQLMNSEKIELLKKLSLLCGIICKVCTAGTSWLFFCNLYAPGQQINYIIFNSIHTYYSFLLFLVSSKFCDRNSIY